MQDLLENCECDLGVREILDRVGTNFTYFEECLEKMKKLGFITEPSRKKRKIGRNLRIFKVTKKGKQFLRLMNKINQLTS